MSASLTLTTNSMTIDKGYEGIDGENCGYDYAKNGQTQKKMKTLYRLMK